MTKKNARKSAARQVQHETGVPYMSARRHVGADSEPTRGPDSFPRPSGTGLHALADVLADELAARGAQAPHDVCVEIVRERADAIAAGLHIQRRSALRYLDAETLGGIADSVIRQVAASDLYAELSDPAARPLDTTAPPNALALAHDARETFQGILPVLCVRPVGLLAPELLADLLQEPLITAAYQTCGGGHEGPCDMSPTEHPHMAIHLNGGRLYGHENCVVLDVCAGCDGPALTAVIAAGGAVLQAHVASGGPTLRSRVQLVDHDGALTGLESMRARLLT